MKALSLSRPWDYLILHPPFKDVENRNWPTKFRGRIYVHRAKSVDRAGWGWIVEHAKTLSISEHALELMSELMHVKPYPMQSSGIVGEVDITKVLRKASPYSFGFTEDGHHAPSMGDQQRELELMKAETPQYFSPWFFGPFGFVLANPKAYDVTIPYRGMTGLFDVELGNGG